MLTFDFKGFDGLPKDQPSASNKVGSRAAGDTVQLASCQVEEAAGQGSGAGLGLMCGREIETHGRTERLWGTTSPLVKPTSVFGLETVSQKFDQTFLNEFQTSLLLSQKTWDRNQVLEAKFLYET